MQAFSAAGQSMYQAQAAQSPGGGAGPESGEGAGAGAGTAGAQAGQATPEDVVEADYEIVDEEK